MTLVYIIDANNSFLSMQKKKIYTQFTWRSKSWLNFILLAYLIFFLHMLRTLLLAA